MLQIAKQYFSSSRGYIKLNKTKCIGLGIGCGSLALIPIASNYQEDGNIVAKVNGLVRFLRSVRIGMQISLDYYFSTMGLNESSPNFAPMMSRIHQRAADNILQGCLLNGGSYIKLGQGLVSLSHILPKEYINTLKALQDKCLARKQDEINRLFKIDFGKEPLEIFKSFESVPIAAASIAQVYKAKTKDNQTVAVKVQYIDLQKRFKSDVATINGLLKLAVLIHPNFNFTWILEDLKDTLKQELDFINEGLNGERCARDLQHLKYIYVPKVLWDYTSSRVLVTEFIDGYKINEADTLKKNGFSLTDINNKLFEAFGHQIFQTGFVHADPHPGNILVRKNNGKTELVLLDHGLYQQVPENERKALSHMWNAIILNDHVNMKIYSNKLGVEDYELFAQILTQHPAKTHGFKLRAKLTEEDLKLMTEYARNRFDNIILCMQNMPRNLLLVLRNLNIIRAISYDHGSPIDRYAVLARAATKTIYSSQSITEQLICVPLKLYFEIVLNVNRIRMWLTAITFKIFSRLGMMPDVKLILAESNIS